MQIFEDSNRHKLCSIHGVLKIALKLEPKHPAHIKSFVEKYGVPFSGDWKRDAGQVVSEQCTNFAQELEQMKTFRDKRIAHMDIAPLRSNEGPTYDSMERMILFADSFHSFIGEIFVGTHSEPVSEYKRIQNSFSSLLHAIGIEEPKTFL
jgi:hypothetical protein